MKKNILFAVFVSLILNVNAQDKNMRETGPYEIYTSGKYNLSGPQGGGFALGVDKFFPLNERKTISAGFGFEASQIYSKNFGTMTGAYAKALFRVGKKAGLQLEIPIGLDAMGYEDHATNGVDRVVYYGTSTKVALGGGLKAFWSPTEKITISTGVNYLYSVNSGDRVYGEAEGWTHEPTTFYKTKAQAEVKIAYNVGGGQVSGDSDWRLQPIIGYEVAGNKGTQVGVEFYHSHRIGHSWRRILGGGFAGTFSDGKTFTKVYGKAGLQWEPWGAKSPVLFNFGVMPGLTEALKYEEASTETGSYYMTSNVQVPALMLRGYLEMEVPFGSRSSWRGIVGCQAGADINFQTFYNYSKDTPGKLKGAGTVYVGVAKAL